LLVPSELPGESNDGVEVAPWLAICAAASMGDSTTAAATDTARARQGQAPARAGIQGNGAYPAKLVMHPLYLTPDSATRTRC